MPGAILFDLDGVLIHSYEVWFELLKAAARDLAGGPVTREAFAAAWGQGIEADVERFFPGHTTADVERYYQAHFLDHAGFLKVDPEASAVLRELRARAVPTVLITN